MDKRNNEANRILLIVLLLLIDCDTVKPQECSSPDIEDWQFQYSYDNPDKIDASFMGTILEFQMDNTVGIEKTENSNMDKIYIDANFENNLLKIFTTNAFPDYEKEQSSVEIVLIIKLNCATGKRDLIFRQKIEETNNHSPEFSQDIYEITILLPVAKNFDLTYFQEISATDIDLRNNRVTFSSSDSAVITVGTSSRMGDDGKTFYATLVTNQQILTIEDKIEFTIVGTDSGNPPRSGYATVIIKGDSASTFIPSPMFLSALYKGLVDINRKLSIEKPEIRSDTYTDEVTFDLTGDDSSLLIAKNNENSVEITLSRDLTDEDLDGKTYLSATLNAYRPEATKGSAVLLFDIATTQTPPTTPTPMFENSMYSGNLNEDLELSVPNIVLKMESYTEDVKFEIEGADASFFDITNQQNVVFITLKEDVSNEDLESKTYLSFKVIALNSKSEIGETIVLINIPEKSCPDCPTTTTPEPVTCPATTPCPTTTTPEPITCPSCPTPPPPIVDLTPQFENKLYNFWIKSNDQGVIGQVFAEIDTTEDVQISYNLDITSENLIDKLLIDHSTGVMCVVSEIEPGEYCFNIIARNNVDDKQGVALAKLTVEELLTCPIPKTTVDKVLVVEYLEENVVHDNILTTKIEDCFYTITEMIPNDKNYFYIDSNTNSLSSIMLDRESDIFTSYEVPQIQVKLRLECDSQKYQFASDEKRNEHMINTTDLVRHYTDPINEDGRYYILTNGLNYAEDITYLTIIIKDINDNYPEFEYPLDNTILGYPEPSIAEQILLPHLVEVRATDRDAGINATIKYTIKNNDHFLINEENGIIYPSSLGIGNQKSIDLEITATDRYGNDDGLKTTIHLQVFRLEIDHLTVLSVNIGEYQSVDDILVSIKTESGINLIVLHYAYVSTEANTMKLFSFWRQSDSSALLKMIVYAFDDAKQLITTENIQKQLENVGEDLKLSYSSYDESVKHDHDITVEDNLVLLIVIAVLGVLLLGTGIGILFLWWYKIRPYEFNDIIDDNSSQVQLQDHDIAAESSPPLNASRFDVQKKNSNVLQENTEKDANEEFNQLDRPLSIIIKDIDIDAAKENRKSQTVTFNELVERIDIETGHSRDSDDDIRL